MLKGHWTIARHDFTDVALNGENIPLDDIKVPSDGYCKIISQSSSDPRYEAEVVKSSVVHYRRIRPSNSTSTSTSTLPSSSTSTEESFIGSQGEKYAFRRKNGIWSLWDVGGGMQNPTCSKVADFRLKEFKEEWGDGVVVGAGGGPWKVYRVILDASPWHDEYGRNFFQMGFVLMMMMGTNKNKNKRKLEWELRCRFDDHLTGTVRQWMDVCVKVDDDDFMIMKR
jgi:hypothetical protein